ncbi:formate dehydrogenase accessory sulfurtransferase FdhD [Halalkalibacter sp. APA_J-10(15)]|uniref:formate dehydrogenase accessory sulfurtransferase FdhD n=1 Tax=unclassified Halalkalibacter TaxID=2893063 RepID=UPI001FF25756|nr:formate dehydrogenase accessory sulfurtransferase FdhD [Halalkalibacter sp. APA_J-10(15)]MCK0470435.1 formate dehydrogenase accessory sulfurtransferase FdhD [Halalkalibacter sp. APA_J-10(15)]
MNNDLNHQHAVIKYQHGAFQSTTDAIVEEAPLTIYINQEEFATLLCSPTYLKELMIGFLASEGIIIAKKEVESMHIDDHKGAAYVTLVNKKVNMMQTTKRVFGSCCGKSRQFYFQNDMKTAKTAMSTLRITPDQCIALMETLQQQSEIFQKTGGVHNAALATPDHILLQRSDIGRHNALDKLYGHALIQQQSLANQVLVFSGRISSEILLKAAKMRISILLSKSAPTTLAIELAKDLNMTIVGFIREQSFNVYSHPERIIKRSN